MGDVNLVVVAAGVVVVGALVGLWVLSRIDWRWQGKGRRAAPVTHILAGPSHHVAMTRSESGDEQWYVDGRKVRRSEVPGATARLIQLRRRPATVIPVFSPLPPLDPLPSIDQNTGGEMEPGVQKAGDESDEGQGGQEP